jgi:hypothetical protein
MPDTWETRFGLNPLVDDSLDDPDGDGTSNVDEYRNGTDPKKHQKSGEDEEDQDGFDWGDCAGSGRFQQEILQDDVIGVGEIPTGKEGVYIALNCDDDVDIQLYDKETGKMIIGWTPGNTSLRYKTIKTHHGVSIEYSGYWGVNNDRGHEYIRITGTTNRTLIMKVFGYVAGFAEVAYSWVWTEGCTPDESGEGSFQQGIAKNAAVEVGILPPGLSNVYIELISDNDVDIQLYDQRTGEMIIGWVPGKTSLRYETTETYQGVTIEYSGYWGIDGDWGHEYIRIPGTTNRPLVMKAFGYAAGNATVNYWWGEWFHKSQLAI